MDHSTERQRETAANDSSLRLLVDDFRNGDPAAVEEVRERVRNIIAYSRFRIPIEDQEELRQEVLIQIWRSVNRDGFDDGRGFWGFVQTVASRRCIDWMRTRRPAPVEIVHTRDARRGPLSRLLASERQTAFGRVLDGLAPACRELIELRLEQDKSYAEISSQLGRSEEALRAQMYRCICKARDLVNDIED